MSEPGQVQVPAPQPRPEVWLTDIAPMSDGTHAVKTTICSITGQYVAFLTPDVADHIAGMLTQEASRARTTIATPPKMLFLPNGHRP